MLTPDCTQTIYEDDFVRVLHYSGDGTTQRLLGTFNSHIPPARMKLVKDRPLRGGWEDEVVGARIPTLFFIEKQNLWFNLPALERVLDEARRVRDLYRECTLVGASLGAHAAIRLSRRMKASTVVAVSPQYCIRPALVASFERRWQKESKEIDEITAYDAPISRETVAGDVYLIVDGKHPIDPAHITQIEAQIHVARTVDLPHSGHSSARALADLELISPMLRVSKANAEETIAMIESVYRERWRTSPTAVRIAAEAMPSEKRLAFLESCTGVRGHQRHMEALAALVEEARAAAG